MSTAISYTKSSIPKVARKPKPAGAAPKTTARYLRDTSSGAISARTAPLRSHRDDVRQSWERTAGLAMDLIQNSGLLKGACDQVLADTVGVGLTLSPAPDLDRLGYSEEEQTKWIRLVKKRWRAYWGNAKECDMQGKLTGAKMVDIALRWFIAYGEVTAVFDFFEQDRRDKYGLTTGTKLRLYPPTRLVQDTHQLEQIFQGVRHDENGRVVAYRFETSTSGFKEKRDFAAYDTDGRPLVLHVFDAIDSEDVRGISQIAPAIRKHIQAEMLGDATLQMAILQTVFAITLTSDAPSQDAYEALEVLKESEDGKSYAGEYLGFLGAKLNQAAQSKISVGADPQVSHLGPGEKLGLETPKVPGQDYTPFHNTLLREMARAIGVTFGGLTMDHTDATYASSRMEMSSVWPVVVRRRERIAVPVCQGVYANWLDEEIGEGRIPFKGGYRAFRANRDRVCTANWQGPAKPTADDHKAAKASSERLKNGTSSIAIETGDLGVDPDALFDDVRREHQRYVDAGMDSPFASQTTVSVEPKDVVNE